MESKQILIVEDEWNMRNLIKIYLSEESNYVLDEVDNGFDALEKLKKYDYDLVILDIMLPKLDGWEVAKRLRELSNLPILMLTARSDVKDKVQGLGLGADDYLTKPFAPEELIARVKALLRRSQGSLSEVENHLVRGNLSILLDSREVKVGDSMVDLTQKEYELLLLFVRQPKRVFTREQLLEQFWINGDERDLRTIDTHVKNIRDKLKRAHLPFNPIKTVWGVGYRFGEVNV